MVADENEKSCVHLQPRVAKILMRPCASPHAPVAGHCGARIRLDVRHHWSRKHLPIVALRRAAYPKRFGISLHRRLAPVGVDCFRCAPMSVRWASCSICAVKMPTDTGIVQSITVQAWELTFAGPRHTAPTNGISCKNRTRTFKPLHDSLT